MKMKSFLIVALLLIGNVMFAQEGGFTRGKGFLVRPEAYGGFLLNLGYQFNPYFQVTLGGGLTIDPSMVAQAGVRVYTNDDKWAGMIDYHYRVHKYSGNMFSNHLLAGGASFKDLDFGVGIQFLNMGGNHGIVPAITIGYNIRFYKHR